MVLSRKCQLTRVQHLLILEVILRWDHVLSEIISSSGHLIHTIGVLVLISIAFAMLLGTEGRSLGFRSLFHAVVALDHVN